MDQLLAADAAFRGMLAECVAAGPARCAMAGVNGTTTAAELEATLLRMAETFKRAPLAVGDAVVTYKAVMELLFLTIKYPSSVATAAQHIADLVLHTADGRDLTGVVEYFKAVTGSIALGPDDDAVLGIKCGDTFPRAATLADAQPDIDRMVETSELFGRLVAGVVMQCARWPFVARERYAGDFVVRSRFPVLFVGNTYDPATPVASARNMSASFEGSVVLEHRGFGVRFLFSLPPSLSLSLYLIAYAS